MKVWYRSLTARSVAPPCVALAVARADEHMVAAAAQRDDAAALEALDFARRKRVGVGAAVAELTVPAPAPGQHASRLGEDERVVDAAGDGDGGGGDARRSPICSPLDNLPALLSALLPVMLPVMVRGGPLDAKPRWGLLNPALRNNQYTFNRCNAISVCTARATGRGLCAAPCRKPKRSKMPSHA